MKNGHRITISALLERAEKLALSDQSNELDRTMLLLLIALANRQNEIFDSVEAVKSTPIVALSEFVKNNKAVSLFAVLMLLIGLVVVANVGIPDIINALQLP